MVLSLIVWLRAGVPQALSPSVHGAHSTRLLREVVAVSLHPPHATCGSALPARPPLRAARCSSEELQQLPPLRCLHPQQDGQEVNPNGDLIYQEASFPCFSAQKKYAGDFFINGSGQVA